MPFCIVHANNGMPALLAGNIQCDSSKESVRANYDFCNHNILFISVTRIVCCTTDRRLLYQTAQLSLNGQLLFCFLFF